ncbi:hypothetical protein EBB56_09245 [Halomonas sp. YLB-10]|uniref:phage tail-collar fiber domain-containing protein n=1 Tax=Halomonas sp. YLB-10 TaxID=2483111 RepID=UPI000F5E4FAB|nr:phage tail protein [Halomonas sp. YLB-10]RQW71335.1 hypothetical protein EBB56_09245 [Halomonas sp. YLB-10]
MPSFYTLPTALGEAKIANAIALGTQVNISELAVGDGGGSLPTPDSDRTALVNELRRAPINRIEVDDENPNWIVVEQILPPDVGGWTVRELGLLDDDGNLIAYGNYPETYKPVLSEGSGRTQTIRFVMQVSDTAAVTLKVDPSVVLATREYVDGEIDKHEQSRNHPAATESAQGMIQRATSAQAKAGSDNTRAMTPLRVLEAFSQFGIGGTPYSIKTFNNANDAKVNGLYGCPGVSGDNYKDRYGALLVANRGHSNSSQTFQINFGDFEISTRGTSDGGDTWSKWTSFASTEMVASMIADARSSNQFSEYDSERVYRTGEIALGSDGVFYEFYDRDQSGTVQNVDPILSANRPHIWMEWHGVRPGTVIEWRSETLPEGYVENDGAAISRADYRRIFSVFGTIHGVGDGSTTFNLPDDRGEFKRGWDHGRGVDYGRALTSAQGDKFRSHSHRIERALNQTGFDSTGGNMMTTVDNNVADPSGSISSTNIHHEGGSETRPRNNAVIYLTKI